MSNKFITSIFLSISRFFAFINKRLEKHITFKSILKKIILLIPGAKSLILKIISVRVGYAKFKPSRDGRELFVDITCVHSNDLKTGIQRVVRSILNEMLMNPTLDFKVEPIFLTNKKGFLHYQYVNSRGSDFEIVVPKHGDIFLGLDLNSNVTAAAQAGMFKDWKSRHAQIAFVIYDILPITNSRWWPAGVKDGHVRWFKAVLGSSDKLVCISKSVCDEVKDLACQFGMQKEKLPLVTWFHLGADIENSSPSKGLPDNADTLLPILASKMTFLMVGTLEPRKGYAQTLAAFESIWLQGIDVNLVIIGKQGWMVDELIANIRHHAELGKRLFWLNGISDEFLEKIYKTSTCLIAASEGEGFGLPLIEAAQHKLSIIARDIPVFREVAGEYAYYFSGVLAEDFASTIKDWLRLYHEDKHPASDNMPWLAWKQSTKQLLELILPTSSDGQLQIFEGKI